MKLLEFYERFPTEESCKQAFIEYRLKEGIVCRKCGSTSHYWKKYRQQWECKKCSFRTTIKSGTVMQNSKLSFRYWFIAMHLLTSTKKSFSAKEVQRQLGHKRYEPVWAMMHKIRSVMGLRDSQYTLKDQVELDEGFFEIVREKEKRGEPLKTGRGSQRQAMIMVMTEFREADEQEMNSQHKHNKQLKFIKMERIYSLEKDKLERDVKKFLEIGSIIKSDNSTSYNNLKNSYEHRPETVLKKNADKALPWVHTMISNAKKLLLNTHHRIDDVFLQNYLNAYVYKLNRRYFKDIFERLLLAAVSFRWNYLGERYG